MSFFENFGSAFSSVSDDFLSALATEGTRAAKNIAHNIVSDLTGDYDDGGYSSSYSEPRRSSYSEYHDYGVSNTRPIQVQPQASMYCDDNTSTNSLNNNRAIPVHPAIANNEIVRCLVSVFKEL